MASFSISQYDEDGVYVDITLSNNFTTTYYTAIVIEAQQGFSAPSHLSEGQVFDSSDLTTIRDAGHLMTYRQTSSHPDDDHVTYVAPMSDIGGEMTLSPGTTYTGKAWAIAASDNRAYQIGSTSTATTTDTNLDTPTVVSSSIGETTASIDVTSVSGADDYHLELENDTTGVFLGTTTSSTSDFYLTNLDSSTDYKATIYATSNSGGSSGTTIFYFTTDSRPKLSIPSIVSTTAGLNSVTMDMGYVSGADRYHLEVWESGVYRGANSSTSSYVTVSGLQSGTYYQLRRWCEGTGYEDSNEGISYITTDDLNQLSSPTITSTSSTDTTITVNINSVTNADEYYYRLETMDGVIEAQNLTSSLSNTFTGLLSGTQYRIEVQARATNYNWSNNAITYETTTGTTVQPLPEPTNPLLTNWVDGGGEFTWDAVAGAQSYTIRIQTNADIAPDHYETIPGDATTVTIKDEMPYGVGIGAYIRANSPYGDTYDSDWAFIFPNFKVTAPKQPTLTVTGVTENTISVQASGLVKDTYQDFDNYRIYIYNEGQSGNVANYITYVQYSATAGATHTFTGLTSGNTYEFRGVTRLDDPNHGWVESLYSPAVSGTCSSRPVNFSWSTNVASGVDFNITATDWNDFTGRINQFQTYTGTTQTGFASVTSGDDFLAEYFNNAVNAISAMNYDSNTYTLPSTKVRGDDVYASYLIALKDCLNSIP